MRPRKQNKGDRLTFNIFICCMVLVAVVNIILLMVFAIDY